MVTMVASTSLKLSSTVAPGQPVPTQMPRQLFETGHAIVTVVMLLFVYIAKVLSNRFLVTNPGTINRIW